MYKKVLVVLVSLLVTSCVKAADEKTQKAKQALAEFRKRRLDNLVDSRHLDTQESVKEETQKEITKLYDNALPRLSGMTQEQFDDIYHEISFLTLTSSRKRKSKRDDHCPIS